MTSGSADTNSRTGLAFGESSARWVLAATVLGSGLAFIDATVVNVALPAIGTGLDAGLGGLTWVVNAYTVTLSSFILLGGSLGDRLGRKRVFVVGVVWFAIASLVCGLAPNIEALIAARALQGVGGALLTPGSLAIIQASFREEDRSRAIGAWSGLTGIAAALGPLLGGWLVEVASWRWIFLINLPFAIAVVAIAHRHVPESRDPAAPRHTDILGAGLVAVGLGALTYGLISWPTVGGGAPQVVVSLALGVVALGAFVARERVAEEPMLPLNIFSSRVFTATNAVTFMVYAAISGVFFWLVITLQEVSGFSPVTAGLTLLPTTVLMLLLSARVGVLNQRIGPRVPMTVGPLITALGVAGLLRVGPDSTFLGDVLLPSSVFGLGLALTVTPLTATALDAVPEAQAGLASGVNNAVARLAGLIAIAVLPIVVGLSGHGYNDPALLEPAYRGALTVCLGLLVLGGVLAFAFVRRPKPLPEAPCMPVSERPTHYCAVSGPPLTTSDRS
jgi:EmrB/QacA subfamily drug resistance transporter